MLRWRNEGETEALARFLLREPHRLLADAAQSLGARRGGRGVGTMGDAAATSFFPSKPLGAYGDGGALLTADPARARLWRSLRNHGTDGDPYDGRRIGTNSRLDTLQAAVLLAKLPHFPGELRRRNGIARAYDEGLRGVAETPKVPPATESAWAQYSVLVDDRDRVRAVLEEAGVPSRVYYPIPLPRQEAFRGFAGGGAWPVADRLGGADPQPPAASRAAGRGLRAGRGCVSESRWVGKLKGYVCVREGVSESSPT